MLGAQAKVFRWQDSSWILAKVVLFCFRFASFGKVCIEMPGVLEWFFAAYFIWLSATQYGEPTFFFCF